MKKIFTLFFAASLTSAAFAQEATTTFVVDNVEYIVTGETTVGLSGLTNEFTATELSVPSEVENEGKTYSVTSVEEDAIYWSDLTKLVLPEGVTELKETAIYSNDYLEEIVLPESLTTLSRSCFGYNDVLNNLVIPAGVTEIPASCFSNCKALTNLTLKGQYTSIGNGAFYKVPIAEITIPGSCKTIGEYAFQLCPELTTVTLEEGVETLLDGAFRECHKLTSISLPESLQTIDANVFLEDPLTTLHIPANVSSIAGSAFAETTISEYTVAAENKSYKAVDGIIYSADDRIIVAYPPMKEGTEYTVADGCVGVGNGAFYGAKLTKVVLPESVIAIDSYAFTLSALADITLPNSVILIGEQAFAGTQLTTFTFPEGINAIYDATLAQCPNLTSVTIPANVRYIGFRAFLLDEALTEVHCLGAEPADLDYYDDYDHPFGMVDETQVTLSVPAGRLDAYKNSDWGYKFSNIVDTEKAIFYQEAVTPANESELAQIETIEITFPTEATIVNNMPEVTVLKDNELYGDKVEDYGWMAVNNSSDKKTVSVFPLDEYGEGYVQPITLENEVEYFVTIPAGIVKDSEGALNQAIVLTFTGKAESSVSAVESGNCFVLNTANGFDVVLGGLQNATVEMFSTTGALVNKVNNANGTVSLNADANGMYIIRVIDGNKAYTFKVVK